MLVTSGPKVDGSEPTACDMLAHCRNRTAKSISDFLDGQNVVHVSPLGRKPGGATEGDAIQYAMNWKVSQEVTTGVKTTSKIPLSLKSLFMKESAMWEIRYMDKQGQDRVTLVESATRAFQMARDMAARGKRPRVRQCKTDLLLADPECQEIVSLMRRVSLRDAAIFALRWARHDRTVGCLLWPSGQKMPSEWKVSQDS